MSSPEVDPCLYCMARHACAFSRLEAEERRRIQAVATTRFHDRGTVVAHQGDAARGVYVVKSGLLRLLHVTAAGKSATVKVLGPGGMVGLTEAISDRRYLMSAETVEASSLEFLDRGRFLDFLGREPRKGDAFTMRDFDRGAMQFHFGIQPVEVPEIGHDDEDLDGVVDEITVAEMTVLHIFDVTNPRPFMEPLDYDTQIGQQKFHQVGCASCHHPEVNTDSPLLPLAQPEDPTDPWRDVYLYVDLRDFGFDPALNGGVKVPMFSDLKRHYMGEGLKETCEGCRVPNGDFITARLWGIADTGPYMHDGRATTLYDAIQDHGGDAEKVKYAYNQLSQIDQIRLINFLRKLRTPENPNVDILP